MTTREKISKLLFPVIEAVSSFFPDYGWGIRLRGLLIRPFLRSCGRNLRINIGAHIYNPGGLTVGDHVYIGFHTYLGSGEITLDDEVVLGPFCSIAAANHRQKNGSVRFGGYEYKPVRIGRGTWLGAHCSVMPGVTVAEGDILAAGAVVVQDTEAHAVYAGVPAKQIKKLR
jgi:maltose O-acetyltransferase